MAIVTIGNKNTHTEPFIHNISETNSFTAGELNFVCRDSCFRLQTTPNIKKRIIKKYLDPIFLEELHANHPYDFFKSYGAFVLKEFTTGGKATALYYAENKTTAEESQRIKSMDDAINASFNISDNGSSANISFGNESNTLTYDTTAFSSVYVSVKTMGGSVPYFGFTPPKEIDEINIDLSAWCSSIQNNTTLIEFNQAGLMPITDFIIEDNIKSKIEQYIEGRSPSYSLVQEPYIVVFALFKDAKIPREFYVQFLTAKGETITLMHSVLSQTEYTNEMVEQIINDWAEACSKLFGIKILHRFFTTTDIGTRATSDYPYKNLFSNAENYRKIIDKGILYIVDETDKVGFSIINDSSFLNQYAMKDIVDKMEYASITFEDLIDQEYYITAL
ncbi:MAC/perforin domain-containing protein [uncultured Muribaculum sp.]|uniref:MAC/perforin domain-containing protein n=3 Tax=uncultured Muribaculum sp. TaxID=1918613 RepID=UPI002665D8FD|nr:MAC/perforin domain-containing protein [uncultured Muribaculum sp.]